MNLITNNALTMSSQEIADLVNARHDSVKRAIERLAEKRTIQLPPLVEVKNHLGQTVEQYAFSGEKGKRDSFVVVAQLSPEFTGAVVDRWQALENGLAPSLPQDLPAALRLAADLAEEKAVLAIENQQQAKKIEALENLFMPGETPTQFAKRLNGVNSQQINAVLLELRWIYNAEKDPEHSPKYRVYSIARSKQWLTEKPITVGGEGIKSFIRYAPVMLEEGTKKLFDLYMAEKLPMKQTWDGQFFYNKFTPETAQ